MATDYERREWRKRAVEGERPPACTCDRGAGTHYPNGGYVGPAGGHQWHCVYLEWLMKGFC